MNDTVRTLLIVAGILAGAMTAGSLLIWLERRLMGLVPSVSFRFWPT